MMYATGIKTLAFLSLVITYCWRRKKSALEDSPNDRALQICVGVTNDDVTPRSIGIQAIGDDIDNVAGTAMEQTVSCDTATSGRLYPALNRYDYTRQRWVTAHNQLMQTTEC